MNKLIKHPLSWLALLLLLLFLAFLLWPDATDTGEEKETVETKAIDRGLEEQDAILEGSYDTIPTVAPEPRDETIDTIK